MNFRSRDNIKSLTEFLMSVILNERLYKVVEKVCVSEKDEVDK